MSVNFVNAMKSENNWTKTENGADALLSTNSSLVDMFGVIGALRTRNENDIISLFTKAFAEDKLLATKMSFYARDIRMGGLGERRTPRIIWRYLAETHPSIMRKNLFFVPEFGRWDDLFIFIGTPVEEDMWDVIRGQWDRDINSMKLNQPISLMAKWLKSVNASSRESVAIAKITASKLGLTEKEYRQTLSLMRSYIDVVEQKMSRKEFDKINYNAVPSKAMLRYRNAFRNRDEARFLEYTNALVSGAPDVKINASTLYPYDIFEGLCLQYSSGWYGRLNNESSDFYFANKDDILEAQWKALPNYVEGENNVVVMADTSGSMSGRPINTSLGLAIYFAERNSGPFHNTFMTFSSKPSFVTLKGDTLYDKIRSVPSIVEDTNLEKAFDMILKVCVENNLRQEDVPKALVVISDMEFNCCTSPSDRKETFYDTMKNKFEFHGYSIPQIIFWNVCSRQNVFHAFSDYKGVQLASGQSPSVFLSIMKNIGVTPYEAMLNVLNNSAYDCITI